MAEQIFEKIQQMAGKKFNVDPSSIEPSGDIFQTLKINSVEVLSLLTELENQFGIEIPDYELQDVKSFGDLVSVIESRV